MITENCQGPFAAKEDEVVLLARPTANGPQGLELRRDRIDHHTAVRVAQNSPRALRLECSVAYDKSDILGRTSWHIERDMFVIAVAVPTRVSTMPAVSLTFRLRRTLLLIALVEHQSPARG